MKTRIITVFFICMFFSVHATAQTGPGSAQNSLLPEINPQDIEIRSEFKASFPGLRRQPILGFNPKPRVYRIDPNRLPFMENNEEAVANISITQVNKPEAPERKLLQTPDRTRAMVKAGYGSFTTPELEGYYFNQINDKNSVTAGLSYLSSDGHLSDQASGFRYADVNGQYTRELSKTMDMKVNASLQSDFNRLFNLDPNLQSDIGSTAKKEYTGAKFGATVKNTKNTLEGWELGLTGSLFSTELDAGSTAYSGDVDEQVIRLAFTNNWAGKRLYETFYANADVETGAYGRSGFESEQWVNAQASAEYRRFLNYNLHINANIGIAYLSDGTDKKMYPVPEFNIRYNFKDLLVIKGQVYGRAQIQTIQELHQANRFLEYDAPIRHTYVSGVYGGVEISPLTGTRIFGGVRWDIIKNYAYFTRSDTLLPTSSVSQKGFYAANYDKANIFEISGGISQQLMSSRLWFDAQFYLRTMDMNDQSYIPFEEKAGITGSVSYKPVKNLTLNTWADLIGKREISDTQKDLKSFVLFNAGAEYQAIHNIGLYVKVLNIFDHKYEIWQGYEERPLQIFGGIILKI